MKVSKKGYRKGKRRGKWYNYTNVKSKRNNQKISLNILKESKSMGQSIGDRESQTQCHRGESEAAGSTLLCDPFKAYSLVN